MSPFAFILILASVTFHASWNMLAKKHHMSIPYYALLCLCCLAFFGHIAFWSPVRYLELPPAFWGFAFASVCSDLLYCNALVQSYKKLEMSSAYPVMRALPIIFTILITSFAGWGRALTWNAVAGFLIVFAGALLVPLQRFSDFRLANYLNSSMFFIVLTALGTTGYTICDSQAQGILREAFPQISKPMQSLSYYSLREWMLSCSLWLMICAFRSHREQCVRLWRERDWSPLPAGLFAGCAYGLVLLAMNYVTNVSYVQVFRQLGLPVGMLFGILFLKEKSRLVKWSGVALILLGLAVSVLN